MDCNLKRLIKKCYEGLKTTMPIAALTLEFSPSMGASSATQEVLTGLFATCLDEAQNQNLNQDLEIQTNQQGQDALAENEIVEIEIEQNSVLGSNKIATEELAKKIPQTEPKKENKTAQKPDVSLVRFQYQDLGYTKFAQVEGHEIAASEQSLIDESEDGVFLKEQDSDMGKKKKLLQNDGIYIPLIREFFGDKKEFFSSDIDPSDDLGDALPQDDIIHLSVVSSSKFDEMQVDRNLFTQNINLIHQEGELESSAFIPSIIRPTKDFGLMAQGDAEKSDLNSGKMHVSEMIFPEIFAGQESLQDSLSSNVDLPQVSLPAENDQKQELSTNLQNVGVKPETNMPNFKEMMPNSQIYTKHISGQIPGAQNSSEISFKVTPVLSQEGFKSLQVSIMPENLGNIKIDLTTNPVTKVTEAHFSFSSQEGFDLFQDNKQSLFALLQKSGLEIQPDKISFDIMNFSDSSQQLTQEQRQHAQNKGGRFVFQEEEAQALETISNAQNKAIMNNLLYIEA
jgi:hypothetical protein